MSETLTQQPPSEQATAVAARGEQLDVLDQLMKPEIQRSLTELVENLPKLAELVALLTKAYDIAATVANDRVLIDDLKGGLDEFVKPIQEKAKGIAAAAVEASDRAAQSENATIGLFGILKMLKDPQVQSMLRFSQAFLTVMAENKKQG